MPRNPMSSRRGGDRPTCAGLAGCGGLWPLLHADRSLVAWEWLRRNPGYRAAAERLLEAPAGGRAGRGQQPERWGLHAFEPPARTVSDARPIWSAELHPHVLGVEACPSDGEDLFDPGRFGATSTLVRAADEREHLLISDGLRAIRIDVLAGTLAAGLATLRSRPGGLEGAEAPARALMRLLALWRTAGSADPFIPPKRAPDAGC